MAELVLVMGDKRAGKMSLLSTNLTFPLMITRWASLLNPVLANPTTNMSILKSVMLSSGNNQIAHQLGRIQQGWVVLDINGAAVIYRNKAFNDSYLYLSSDAAVTVNLGVF